MLRVNDILRFGGSQAIRKKGKAGMLVVARRGYYVITNIDTVSSVIGSVLKVEMKRLITNVDSIFESASSYMIYVNMKDVSPSVISKASMSALYHKGIELCVTTQIMQVRTYIRDDS